MEKHKRIIDQNGCWVWLGAKTKDGYGMISISGNMIRVHRLVWELFNGQITGGLFVCHKCDNPSCCNPDHMFLGTHQDNMRDKIAKGRKNGGGPVRGEKHGSAKLTKKQVLEIRELRGNATEREISLMYGIGKSQVHRILSNQNWSE